MSGEQPGFMTSIPEKPVEEDSSKFYDGYMARVLELQKMTAAFNKELEAIEDSDEEKKPKKSKEATSVASPLSTSDRMPPDHQIKAIEAELQSSVTNKLESLRLSSAVGSQVTDDRKFVEPLRDGTA